MSSNANNNFSPKTSEMIKMYKALYVFDSHITGIYDFSITVYDEDTVKDA